MKNKVHSGKLLPFAIAAGIFITAAVLGWFRLRYGFNFIDEGWQMTESWRLTVGDDFFKDKYTGALRMATLINALVFKLYPRITLLGFRELQFFLTIISLLLLSFALYKMTKEFWYQPIIFSIFAFTGLDPMGIIPNLTYYTYPHLFLTLHLAFFIMGLHQQSALLKRILYITAGVFLWLISFSLLYMSVVFFSGILLFFIIKTFKLNSIDFSLKDLCFVTAPFILLWIIFVGIYGEAFIQNIISSIQFAIASPIYHPSYFFLINWKPLKCIIVVLLFTIAFLQSTKISKSPPLWGILLIISVMMFAIIETNMFGFFNDGINYAVWFSSLLASSYFLLLCNFIFKIVKRKTWYNLESLSLVLFIPSVIAAINSIIFSSLGFVMAAYSSITAIAAITCSILSIETIKKRKYIVQLIILILFFAPFYYTTAWSYWKSNFYDVAPEQSNAVIEDGFGKGIKTNTFYKDLYEWISTTSDAYSKKDDYIISYVSSPMVHMIAKRRPATDDSYHAFDLLQYNHFDKVIAFMKSHKRKPQIAYVFEAMPALVSLNLGNPPIIVWQDKQISFPSDDPLSRYVLANMTMIESFTISKEFSLSVRCFIDNASALSALENKLNINPTNPVPNLQMWNFYQTKRELDKAQKYYQKALDANPEFIPALMQLAINQSLKGNDLNAMMLLKRTVAIDPTLVDAYYNIACIYARRKQVQSSIVWLKKAVDNGFNKWILLKTDDDLENIRGTIYYKLLLKKYCNAHLKAETNIK